jgi:hypothetical protein
MPAQRRRLGKRSRNILLWAMGIFVAVQLTIGLVLDYAWPFLRFPSAAQMLATLPEDPSTVQVLFLGSSRFQVGIAANEIASLLEREGRLERPCGVVNAAVPGGDLITAEFLLGHLLARGVRPRTLVLEISPETLNHYNEWLGFHVVRQLRWEHVPGYWAEACRAGHGMRFLSARLFPLFQYREQLVEWVWGINQTASANGKPLPRWLAKGPVPWTQLLCPPTAKVTQELRDRIQVTTDHQPRRWLRDYRIAGNSPAALERILALCRQQDIRVLLVGVPVTTAHRETYSQAIEQAFQVYVANIQRIYGCGFVDCRDWLADGLYTDNHHLNPEGRLFFSRLLTYRSLLPSWQERPSGSGNLTAGTASLTHP